MAGKKKNEPFLMYKGRPLVRSGKTLYYGNMYEPYVIMMQICSTRTEQELEVANRVTVQLLNTDPNVRPRERIVKKSEKQGLYQALDIAAIWLDRALANE